MRTAFTHEQNIDYSLKMIKVWAKEVEQVMLKLKSLENKPSLEQIKLKRVIREMKEAVELLA